MRLSSWSEKIRQNRDFWQMLREGSGQFEFDACFSGKAGDVIGEVGNIGDRNNNRVWIALGIG